MFCRYSRANMLPYLPPRPIPVLTEMSDSNADTHNSDTCNYVQMSDQSRKTHFIFLRDFAGFLLGEFFFADFCFADGFPTRWFNGLRTMRLFKS